MRDDRVARVAEREEDPGAIKSGPTRFAGRRFQAASPAARNDHATTTVAAARSDGDPSP